MEIGLSIKRSDQYTRMKNVARGHLQILKTIQRREFSDGDQFTFDYEGHKHIATVYKDQYEEEDGKKIKIATVTRI